MTLKTVKINTVLIVVFMRGHKSKLEIQYRHKLQHVVKIKGLENNRIYGIDMKNLPAISPIIIVFWPAYTAPQTATANYYFLS